MIWNILACAFTVVCWVVVLVAQRRERASIRTYEANRRALLLSSMGLLIIREARAATRAGRHDESMRLLALSDMCDDETRLVKDAKEIGERVLEEKEP